MMIDTSAGVYGTLLLSGFLGSLGHCAGMCGPLVLMLNLQLKHRGTAALSAHAWYHGARITVYGLLGMVAGTIGSLFGLDQHLRSIAGPISLILGVGIVFFGLHYLGWISLGPLEGAGAWWNRAMNRTLRRSGLSGIVMLGVLNGLLPCGLVYTALLVAASTGQALSGAVGMLLFGGATIPALLVIGMGASLLNTRGRHVLARAAGVLMLLVGLQLGLRGLAAFTLLPHLKLGGVMIY